MTFLRRASYVLATGLLTTTALRADPPVAGFAGAESLIGGPLAIPGTSGSGARAGGSGIGFNCTGGKATGGSARRAAVVRSPVART